VKAFFLGDLQRGPNALVIGTKSHEAAGKGFVRAVPLASAGK